MVSSFVGGVRDAQGLHGFVEVPPGEVVAIDLAKGAILWRREQIGRPIAATVQRLITLDHVGARFVLRVIDAASGADAGRIENFGMPDLAAKTGLTSDAVQVAASEVPDGIRLEWSLRQPYRGGASPPTHITSKSQEVITGAGIVDLNTSRFTPATFAPPPAPEATAFVREASTDPTVFALDRVGDELFALKAEGSGVTLEARDAHNGTVLWEVPLTKQRADRPTPQRK